MPGNPPIVYLLHGEDAFSIAQYVKELEDKLGDPTIAVLNINRLDGAKCTLDELRTAVSAAPFMTARRLVILSQPLNRITTASAQEELVGLMNTIPATTALVLVENSLFKEEHWLLRWAASVAEKAYIRAFRIPRGGELARWIQDRVNQKGGNITHQAAYLLSGFVSDDIWLVDHEIDKLVSYTNNERVIDEDDVSLVALSIPQGDIFALVDALGMMNKRLAISTLKTLLENQDNAYVFMMIVRQVRLVMLAKEILINGGDQNEVAKKIQLHPYVAGKVTSQAGNFSLDKLSRHYKNLLEIDHALKTGRQDLDVALETFVARFSA